MINQSFQVENGGVEIVEYATKHFQCLIRNNRQAWNGRQIRNAFHTAVALAEYQGKKDDKVAVLRWQHFRSTASASEKFESYLKMTLGYSERELASNEKLRASMDPSTGDFGFTRNQQTLKEELSRFKDELDNLTPFKDKNPRNALSNQSGGHAQMQAGPPLPTQDQTTMPPPMYPGWPPRPMTTGHIPGVQQPVPPFPYGNTGYPQHSTQAYQTAPPPMPYAQHQMGIPTAGYHHGQYPQSGVYGQPPMGPTPTDYS